LFYSTVFFHFAEQINDDDDDDEYLRQKDRKFCCDKNILWWVNITD